MMITPGLSAAFCHDDVFQRRQSGFLPHPLNAAYEIADIPGGFFFAFRLDGICQVNFKIIRCEVRVKQSDKFFFPVALI